MHPALLLLSAFAPPEAAADTIVVTASREPVALEETGVSLTLFDAERIEALALPQASDLLRLAPGASVASSGPRGTQTQLRIRGAEANHTLLFVDGIRFNDPAAGNEARFELLTSDALSRVELVRGPQSALWGSEALGGVVAVETLEAEGEARASALAEYGSLDSLRLQAGGGMELGQVGLSGSAGWMRSDGIDSFGVTGGDRDGFSNRSANLKLSYRPLPALAFGLTGHHVAGTSEYDGFDPVTFRRADTADQTRNRISAVRAWGSGELAGFSLLLDGSYLQSSNRNRLADAPLNSSFGKRHTAGGQLSRSLGVHRFTAALEHEREEFRARDQVYLGGTDQDRARSLTAFVGQWRAGWTEWLSTDIAVRHDRFSAFADATTLRASAVVRPATGWTLHAAYGEGIAQPSFYDLHGFFPGSFLGNPDLRPERSSGWEAGLRWQGSNVGAGLTGFSNRLRDEIVDTFDPETFQSSTANAAARSRRRGIEADANLRVGGVRLGANYTYLQASERTVPGAALVREVRRPKHSANLFADGAIGRVTLGAAVAYVGERTDTDFDQFPAERVKLGDYLLGSLKLGYRMSPSLEAYARVENGFDADYRDVVGYRTAGRTIHAGLRMHLGR
jgi:vitamin B12 transporter